ncbi:hypothetical protein HDU93_006800, partial [Gonapodya sp. JEL0774]
KDYLGRVAVHYLRLGRRPCSYASPFLPNAESLIADVAAMPTPQNIRHSFGRFSLANMSITIPLLDDFHIHLRQDALMRFVTPMVPTSGVGLALVMPNLRPPITTTDMALSYKKDLEALAPGVEFLMSLYLTPELTAEEVRKAKAAGVVGGFVILE